MIGESLEADVMLAAMADRPLAIIGPTASGKSALALSVARALGVGVVEIVSVDSMQIYRSMDIGTAKPTAAECSEIPHHLIDLVEPGEEFTVAEFQSRATEVIADIRGRGVLPVLVGGTGLYMRAVVDGLDIPSRYPLVRSELEDEPSTAALHRRLVGLDPAAADRMEPTNRRRVLRALEVTLGSGRAFSSYGPGLECYSPVPFVMVGLRWEMSDLDARISSRLTRQMMDGFLEEARALMEHPLSRTAAQALGYRDLLAHLRGELSMDEAVERTEIRTRQLARRQMRWFRRDPRILWFDAPVVASDVLTVWGSSVSSVTVAA